MIKNIFIALTIIITGASIFFFNSIYKEAKNYEIKKLNEEQAIYAKQAARGIEDFFVSWTRNLESLSKMDEIIDNNKVDKHYLNLFYEANKEQVKSITFLDERGVILCNFPMNSLVGMDVSEQKHIRVLLRDHKPVVSDVFKAVEGFDSIALHVPVFREGMFKGSIGILIDFESIAKRFLDVIKIGKTGYAWVISRDGTVLYSPVPGVTGKSVYEIVKEYPMLMDMVNKMLEGYEGFAAYTFDRIGKSEVGQTKKVAAYKSVHVGNTFWSIAVTSAEKDVLYGLISFRNKLAFVVGALFICGIVFSALGAKAWFLLDEEDKRKKLVFEIQQKRDELAHVTRVSMMGQLASTLAHEINQPLGAILRNAEAAELFLQDPSPDLDEVRAILADIRKDDQRAGQVIDKMRAMMRQSEVERCLLDFNLLGSEVIFLVQSDADKRHTRLVLNIDKAMPHIYGDRVQLEQVLINLLINSLDALDDKPQKSPLVTLLARHVGATVEVAGSDHGPGISADKLPHVFEPFFSDKPNGLGMGLAISHGIIEAHGGRLWAENNEAGGATFTFALPVAG